jgi:3-hydroxyacyl-CoA dehydrogenase
VATASILRDRRGAVAVFRLDNPPVNALSHALRSALAEALAEAAADASISAIVLAGNGRGFCAGADISEFGAPLRPPMLADLIVTLEGFAKPVVAAIHGTTLGGGFELALGCHARIAAASAKLGLPEIKLGILPGGGGTQRAARLAGGARAFRLIASGDPITAADAAATGLIDGVAEADHIDAAVAHAESLAAAGGRPRNVRDLPPPSDRAAFDQAAAAATAKGRVSQALKACIAAIAATYELSFDEGLAREYALFRELVVSDESRAQRHAFFAERQATKIPDMPADTRPRTIARAAVIGAGTMGGGISMCFANAGVPVALIDTGAEALQRGLDTIAGNYRRTVAGGRMAQAEMDRRLALISGATSLDAVAEADVIIEAVFEEIELKKRVFADLSRLAKPGAVLATNTSYLDVNAIAAATTRPADVLGLHFFSPANVMRLLEIVRAEQTSHETLATGLALARQLGKVAVVSGVCDGFIGNRMLARRSAAGERALLQGALPAEIDAAMIGFGFPMGPYAAGDLAGLDIGMRFRKARGTRAEVADALCEAGRFGQKNGKGYYRYEPGNRTPLADPEVERIILGVSEKLGIARAPIPAEQIVERLVYPMINEGARILEEGIALRPGDIDITWIHGYGWPVWRGGPMFHADLVGLPKIRDALAAQYRETGDPKLEPAPLIIRLAAEGRGFASLG